MKRAGQRLPDGTYIELVATLFATRGPAVVMNVLYAVIAGTALALTHDRLIGWLLGLGVAANAVRLALLFHDRAVIRNPGVTADQARSIEYRFTVVYVIFAAILGAFSARVFTLPDQRLHILAVTLLTGYAAGVAAGTGLRPWIAKPSILLVALPTAAVAIARPDVHYALLAGMLLAFIIGGFRSISMRYRAETSNIASRRLFAELARQDHLTGLPNRLALAEHFEKLAEAGGGVGGIALHCLDLDRFKPVNDQWGHAAGDAVLVTVAARLGELLRGEDFAGRTGGDEFVVVQTGIRQTHEVELMARRIERDLALPYAVADQTLTIGSSVGFAILQPGEPLDELLARADAALRAHKEERRAQPATAVPIPRFGRSALPAG